MKIGVFYAQSQFSAWNMSGGIVATLKRMGHEVTDVPIAPNQQPGPLHIQTFKRRIPNIEVLKSLDAIIVSGPEHIAPWLDQGWTKYGWKNLAVPKAAWYHESFFRDDAMIDFDQIRWCADEHFFPAIQDAELHDQEAFAEGQSHWLPFGVDTDVFKPGNLRLPSADEETEWRIPKDFNCAFIGLLYDKRKAYLQALAKHQIPPIYCGNVTVIDLDGFQYEESVRRLAANYRRIKVFMNLPSLSRLLVTKVYEVLATETFLVTPELNTEDRSSENMKLFESGKHLMYYRPSHMGGTAQMLREWISPQKDAEREAIAAAGCAEVRKNHSLEVRLSEILFKLKVKELVQ
jgi:hypothetical protein